MPAMVNESPTNNSRAASLAAFDQQPGVIERLAGQVIGGQLELVPLPRLAVARCAVDAGPLGRNARQAPRQRIGNHLGHRAVRDARALERLLERRNAVHVVVVIVRHPQPLDRADLALADQFLDLAHDAGVAAVHDEGRLLLRDQHPTGAEVPQAIGRSFAGADGHVVLAARVVGEQLGKVVPQGRNGHVLVVAPIEPRHGASIALAGSFMIRPCEGTSASPREP